MEKELKQNKKETLEEAAERLFDGFGDITKPIVIKRAIELVKWQQERMYSEDDMIMFADFFHNYKELLKKEKWEILELSKKDILKKWFEKFKKK